MKKSIILAILAASCLFFASCGKSGGDKIDKTEAAKYAYVASSEREIFHKPSCRWADKISERNLIGFTTRDEAVKSGRRACKVCEP